MGQVNENSALAFGWLSQNSQGVNLLGPENQPSAPNILHSPFNNDSDSAKTKFSCLF